MNISATEAGTIRDALNKVDALIAAADLMVDDAMTAPINSPESTRFHELFYMVVDEFKELKQLVDNATVCKKEVG